MLALERRAEIMKQIRRDQSVRVSDLSERFDVTEETIRRDLDKLDKEGKVKKTYGGAVLEKYVSEDPSFNDRLKVNMKQKKIIASYADQLIEDGETVFIDMSTTALEVIKHVNPSKNITVLTNSLNALVELSQRSNINLIAIGGEFDEDSLSMVGPMTYKFVDHYYADKTLFSAKSISIERGIMDSKEYLAEIKRHMIKNAKESILLADASKFDKAALVKITSMDNISQVITEYKVGEAWKNYFEKNEIQLTIIE